LSFLNCSNVSRSIFLYSIIIASSISNTGCLSPPYPMASAPIATDKEEAEAKQFIPDPNLAIIYIFRDTSDAWEMWSPILVDNHIIARTVQFTFVTVKVDPGEHEIVCRAEKDSPLRLTVERNKLYFVKQKIIGGILMARSKLVEVSNEDGINAVRRCHLLSTKLEFPNKVESTKIINL
jgi:hypothetical protein